MGKKAKKRLRHLVGAAPAKPKKAKKPSAWDDYAALDRTLLLAETFDFYVFDAPTVQASPGLKLRAERISNDLHDLYQRLGERALKAKKKDKK